MKRILLIAAGALLGLLAAAQEPTTTWPYLYPEFRQGTIYLQGGQKLIHDMNVHIRHDKLHFLDKGGIIKEAVVGDIVAVEIGNDKFVTVNGEMMKVMAENEKGCIAAEILGDFSALAETGGAYGTSSTSSATRKLSSIDTDSQINQNHMLLLQSKNEGKSIFLITKYYVFAPTLIAPATKNDIAAALPADRQAAWKAWLKTNKIKWKDPQSLLAITSFLSGE